MFTNIQEKFSNFIASIKPFLFNATVHAEGSWLSFKAYCLFMFHEASSATIKMIIELLIIFTLAIVGLHYFDKWLHKPLANSVNLASVVANPSPIVQDEPQASVVVKKPVKVFKRSQSIKSKVKLPNAIVQNTNEKVIAAVEIPKNNDRTKTVTTVLNIDTGITSTFVKDEPLPFLSLNRNGEVGLYAGIKNGYSAIRLQAKQNILDIKEIHVNGIGSIDQLSNGQTDYFVGVGASYNW